MQYFLFVQDTNKKIDGRLKRRQFTMFDRSSLDWSVPGSQVARSTDSVLLPMNVILVKWSARKEIASAFESLLFISAGTIFWTTMTS